MLTSVFFVFIAEQIFSYGLTKGLDKIFRKKDKESFIRHLSNIISDTIDDYSKLSAIPDTEDKFPFYKSQIIIEELLKYRIFNKSGYTLNSDNIKNELVRNPRIIKPSHEEIGRFLSIFAEKIINNSELKVLEVEAYYKETIFEIDSKLDRIWMILNSMPLVTNPDLIFEYREELKSIHEEIISLKLKTGIKRLSELEKRIANNPKNSSDELLAFIKFLFGLCYESLTEQPKGYESYVSAYKLLPDYPLYIEKACISYYGLHDPRYKDLTMKIDEHDDYNPITWAIKAFDSENLVRFIKESVTDNVLQNPYFKRLVFNHNLKKQYVNTFALLKVLEISKLSKELPVCINLDNLHHWIFMLNAISIQYFAVSPIPFVGIIKRDEYAILLFELSKSLSTVIINSELSQTYNSVLFLYYWLESELSYSNTSIGNLMNAYNLLDEKDTFKTVLLAIAVQKHINPKEAIDIIDEFKGTKDETLIALKTFCQLQNPKSKETILEYFDYIKIIDDSNIVNVCNFIITIIKSNLINKSDLMHLIGKITFVSSSHNLLISYIISSLFDKGPTLPVDTIDSLTNIIRNDDRLLFFQSLLYFENEYYVECIRFLEGYIDEDKESSDLFLLIRALYLCKSSSQLKLLRILKNWRLNFSFNEDSTRMELELTQILHNWDEIKVIAEYGLSFLPDDEQFFTLYIISLANIGDYERINSAVSKIISFDFELTDNVIILVNILINRNHPAEGLELLYKKAKNKNDSLARMNFFSLTINFPKDYFTDPETVTYTSYVKFDIDGEIETIHIDPSTSSNSIVKKSIGKSINDVFYIENQLSKKLRPVKVLRIMNKYSALIDEILTEATSPFSNLPMESVTFDPSNIESFKKSFIATFGGIEDERKKQTEINFQEYYTYKISFTELVISNFNGSFIDAYNYLTSQQSDGLRIKPLKYLIGYDASVDKIPIIDFSTGLLFFELSTFLNMKFEKFIISKNLYILIDKLIVQTESERSSKMKIAIQEDKLIPYFYPDNYHDKRIDFLLKLKTWFQDTSDAIIPEEKIDIVRPIYEKASLDPIMELLIDSLILGQRKGYVLVSDDLFYSKLLHFNNYITSEKYLAIHYSDKTKDITEYMLKSRYVGLRITSNILYSSFINQNKENNRHIYFYALRNLVLREGYNSDIIETSVDFLKKIALSPSITIDNYRSAALNLFVLLIPNFPNPLHIYTLKERIKLQFELMGKYQDITMFALLDALRIQNNKYG